MLTRFACTSLSKLKVRILLKFIMEGKRNRTMLNQGWWKCRISDWLLKGFLYVTARAQSTEGVPQHQVHTETHLSHCYLTVLLFGIKSKVHDHSMLDSGRIFRITRNSVYLCLVLFFKLARTQRHQTPSSDQSSEWSCDSFRLEQTPDAACKYLTWGRNLTINSKPGSRWWKASSTFQLEEHTN